MNEQKTPQKPAHTYRLLHTADWHLGKLLNDQARDEEHQLFLDWLLATVKEYQVDAIILAGDVFDSSNPPQAAMSRYYAFVSRLYRETSCALAVVAGNHDSAAVLEAPKHVLAALNVHVVGYLGDSVEEQVLWLPNKESAKLGVAMIPFLRERDLRVGRAGEAVEEIRTQLSLGIAARYQQVASYLQDAGKPVIATGHLTVVGASTSDSEREIHIGGLGAVGSNSFPDVFAYVALGHLHRPQATDAAGRVRYAGSPIALSFSEACDAKEVRLLDIAGQELQHWGIEIPVFRRLMQLQTTDDLLESDLAKLVNEGMMGGMLPPWIEVVVTDAGFDFNLVDRVRRIAEGKPYEVLKVMRGNVGAIATMTMGNEVDETMDVGSILDQPENVFHHLLEKNDSLTPEEQQSLKTTFAMLMDAYHQSQTTEQP